MNFQEKAFGRGAPVLEMPSTPEDHQHRSPCSAGLRVASAPLSRLLRKCLTASLLRAWFSHASTKGNPGGHPRLQAL